MKAIGYCRVSTDEQVSSGLGIAAQRAALEAECERRDWPLRLVMDQAVSGARRDRPGLHRALRELKKGDVLMVARLDRLSRSLSHFAQLLERAEDEGWSVVALDLGIDTTTPTGELLAHMTASVSQYERRLISERTRAALQQLKRQGHRLGAPRQIPDAVRARIVAERARGWSIRRIAEGLTRDLVPTVRGAAGWHPSTVATVLAQTAADRQETTPHP